MTHHVRNAIGRVAVGNLGYERQERDRGVHEPGFNNDAHHLVQSALASLGGIVRESGIFSVHAPDTKYQQP
jgi:hypothetical protein